MIRLERKERQGLRLPTVLLGLYFVLLPFDCLRVGEAASLLRIIAILPVISVLIFGNYRKLYLNSTIKLLMVFIALASISTLYSIDRSITFEAVKTLLLNIAMIIIMAALYEYREREEQWLFGSLLIGSWVTIGIMLFNRALFQGRLTFGIGTFLQDPNYVNGYMLFAFGYHINRFIEKKTIKDALLSGLIFIVVIATGSRGSLLAYVGCLLIRLLGFIRGGKGRFKKTISIILIAAICCLLFIPLFSLMDAEVLERYSIDFLVAKGTVGRIGVWKYLLKVFVESNIGRILFGHGYGTVLQITANGPSGVHGKVAHNYFLEILLGLGVVGFVFVVSMYICIFRILKKRKEYMLISIYSAFIIMYMSLSMMSYKPMWSIIMLILIRDIRKSKSLARSV